MLISLASTKYLFDLLAHLLTGIVALNDKDPALKPIIASLNQILANQVAPSLPELLQLVTNAQEIVKGYEEVKGSDGPSENPIENLPAIFYELQTEIDNLITKEKILNKNSLDQRIKSLRSQAYFLYRICK